MRHQLSLFLVNSYLSLYLALLRMSVFLSYCYRAASPVAIERFRLATFFLAYKRSHN
jgi:hypothetical protein